MVTNDQSWVLGGGTSAIKAKKLEPLMERPVGSELAFLVGAIDQSSKNVFKIYVEIFKAVK